MYVFSEMGKDLASFYICQLSGSRCSTGSQSLDRESEPGQGVRAWTGSQSLDRESEPGQGVRAWTGCQSLVPKYIGRVVYILELQAAF